MVVVSRETIAQYTLGRTLRQKTRAFLRFVDILKLFVGDLRVISRKTANKTARNDDVAMRLSHINHYLTLYVSLAGCLFVATAFDSLR